MLVHARHTQPAGPALVLKLREGVTFHDGAPLDAEAVKYNLERAAAEGSNIAADVESIESVEVVDDLTVKLNLTAPNSALVMTLADRAGMMVSPKAAEAAGGDLSTNPVGAGGWKFVDWKRGTSMTYEKFDDYWDSDVERVDKVVIRVMPEPKTRATSLRSGQQDIAWDIVPADAESIQGDDKLTLHEQPRMWTWMIYTNRASEELGDPRVRRALSLAMDRDTLLKSAYFGLGTKPRGFLPDGYWAEPSEKAQLDYDVDEAKRLIAEAGAEGLTFDLLLYADSTSTRVGEILKQQWSEIGVTANLVPREVNQANSDYFNDVKTPAFFAAWTGRPDPALTYRLMFTKDGVLQHIEAVDARHRGGARRGRRGHESGGPQEGARQGLRGGRRGHADHPDRVPALPDGPGRERRGLREQPPGQAEAAGRHVEVTSPPPLLERDARSRGRERCNPFQKWERGERGGVTPWRRPRPGRCWCRGGPRRSGRTRGRRGRPSRTSGGSARAPGPRRCRTSARPSRSSWR